MRALHKILTALIILLGIAHVAFTFRNYKDFEIDAFWFAAADVAIVLAGFINIATLRSGDAVIRSLYVLTNVLFAVMFAAASFLFPEPQVYFGILIFSVSAVMAALIGNE